MSSLQTKTEKSRLLTLATTASVATAVLLIVVKAVAWLLTGSVSILASLVDSIMDSLASLINLFAVRYSLQPADNEHQFGHGKAESLAGLAQAGFISGSAVFLVLHAIDRLRFPHELEDIMSGVIVMVFSIIVTLALLILQRYVIRKTASTAIRADALHYASDVLTNASIIAALYLTSVGLSWADPVFAIAIAFYIFYSAFRIGFEAFQMLMDHKLTSDIEQQIRDIAVQQSGVSGMHDLRTRQSGQISFVQLHLELDKNITLEDAHNISDKVEQKIRKILPEAEIIIHQDPVVIS